MKHTIQNPDFFDKDKTFNEAKTKHKNSDSKIVKYDCILFFQRKVYPHFKSELYINQTENEFENVFTNLDWII